MKEGFTFILYLFCVIQRRTDGEGCLNYAGANLESYGKCSGNRYFRASEFSGERNMGKICPFVRTIINNNGGIKLNNASNIYLKVRRILVRPAYNTMFKLRCRRNV